MTDNECLRNTKASLQSLLASIDAQLEGQPSHPVDPPPPPPPALPDVSERFAALVAQRPPLDLAALFFLNGGMAFTPAELAYARAHNVPGSTPVDPNPDAGQNAGERNTEHHLPSFDPAVPNSYRFMEGEAGQTATKTYPANASGTLEVSINDSSGNTGTVDFELTGPGVHVSWPGCHLPFNDKVPGIQAGQSYQVAVVAPVKYDTTVRLSMVP